MAPRHARIDLARRCAALDAERLHARHRPSRRRRRRAGGRRPRRGRARWPTARPRRCAPARSAPSGRLHRLDRRPARRSRRSAAGAGRGARGPRERRVDDPSPCASRSGSMAKPAPPASMKCWTCAFDALEQLPDTIAAVPAAGGSARRWRSARGRGSAAGRSRRPSPAISSGRLGEGAPQRHQVGVGDRIDDRERDACALQRGDALADGVGAGAHRPVVDQADARVAHWRCSTRTRLASVIGVSGWSRMPLSFSSTAPTNR